MSAKLASKYRDSIESGDKYMVLAPSVCIRKNLDFVLIKQSGRAWLVFFLLFTRMCTRMRAVSIFSSNVCQEHTVLNMYICTKISNYSSLEVETGFIKLGQPAVKSLYLLLCSVLLSSDFCFSSRSSFPPLPTVHTRSKKCPR